MTLLKYGEMRKTAFAPGFDLVVYGFSAAEANNVMKKRGYPLFERGELLSRLGGLEKKRRLADGFTTSLSREEVRQLVLCLPNVLLERSRRFAPPLVSKVTDDDRLEMGEKAKMLIDSVKIMADRVKTLRATGREWEDNPGKRLQTDLGIEYC